MRAFSRVLSGRFPEEWLLSHDLIEGAHVRVGLASDIELYDEFPQSYLSYTRRQHRWIRGDWQIADWILPWVPEPGGRRVPNPLSWFDRWKIFDNLRRSLIPTTSLGLLIASWLTSPQMGWISTLVVAMQLLFHPFAQPFTMATTRQGLKSFSFSKVAHDLLRTVADAALLRTPGLAGSGCHSAGVVSPPHLSPWVARVDFGPGDPSECPASAAMVCSFFGPGEPIQWDRGLGGAALDALQPCDGQPLARLVVPLPSARLALEPSTAGGAKATPAA